jgi:3'-phosphoadenosine 5'-phosphosulfate (PAPS) 3'-phosphatase
LKVEIKADESPLTAVDQDSHECIMERLIETGFLIVSEEAKELPFDSP